MLTSTIKLRAVPLLNDIKCKCEMCNFIKGILDRNDRCTSQIHQYLFVLVRSFLFFLIFFTVLAMYFSNNRAKTHNICSCAYCQTCLLCVDCVMQCKLIPPKEL